MSKFYTLRDDTVEIFNSIYRKKAFMVDVNFQFVGCEQKALIKVTKIPDQFVFILEKELLVTINDELISQFDDESIQILIEQEIDKIEVNLDTGKIKLIKPDLTTFSALVSKYGIEKVSRANQVQTLAAEQSEDANDGFIA